jgi:flagellar hook-associated protein 2
MEEKLGISFGSINTGLPKDIVKQIIAAERLPVQKMQARKADQESRKVLITELTSLVEAIRGDLAKNPNSRSLRELKVDTREDLVGVTIDKNIATPGVYQIEVVDLAQKSSGMSSAFADKDDSDIGVGFIQYTLPDGETKEIYIDSDNASLSGVAKLINQDDELGITATVVNDGSGADEAFRLILSLRNTGDDQKAEFPYFYFVDGDQDLYLEFEREAHDAKVKLDGFEIEAPENKILELIPGVTIDLKKAAPGEEFTIKIDEDVQKVTEKIVTLVDKINAVLQFIKSQNTLDANTNTKNTLGGDSLLQSLEGRIRKLMFNTFETSKGTARIGDIGVTFQKDGLLKFDVKKFEGKVSSDYKFVSDLLTGQFVDGKKIVGFMDNLNTTVSQALRVPDGLLTSRKKGIQSKIDQIDRRITQKERHLEQKENNLKQKFSRLEGTIARIKNQGSGLAALGANASNAVTQLG